MPDIPNDFNWKIYLELNPDIKSNAHFCNEAGAKQHWEKMGCKEGRIYKWNLPNSVKQAMLMCSQGDEAEFAPYVIKIGWFNRLLDKLNSINDKRTVGYIQFPHLIKPNPISRGFFSNYFFVLSMIIDCHQQNFRPYVNLDNTSFLENYNPYIDNIPKNRVNTWDWWFEQRPKSNYDKVVSIKYSTKNISHAQKMWGNDNLKSLREINDRYIKIKDSILEEINKYYTENFKNKVVLGVMARGSEMPHIHPEYGNQTINTWIDGTKEMIKKHPEINMIFLVTEDSNYIPIYLNDFPDTFYLKDVFRRTTESDQYVCKYPLWPNIANPRQNHNQRLGEECLIQAKLLGMCDYLLVKHCGTTSAAILFANDNLKDVLYK